MKIPSAFLGLAFSAALAVFNPVAYGAPDAAATHTPSVVGDVTSAAGWYASKWQQADADLFDGAPVYRGEHKHLLLLRYSYYVSQYDCDRLCPLWVLHTDVGDLSEKAKMRTKGHDPKWERVGFYTDAALMAYSKANHLPYVVDAAYNNCNPSEFPGANGTQTHLTRGHHASNEEMKLQGNEDDGVQSQRESFSLANVAPQTQANNAPLWATLEEDCLTWSSKLGRVAVITGPVFKPEQGQPIPVGAIITTTPEKGPTIPIPTHFYKVVIGKIDGKTTAIGFLVPHLSNLTQEDYRHYAVPISKIEGVTSLTFMPRNSNLTLKTSVDARWLAMIPVKVNHN